MSPVLEYIKSLAGFTRGTTATTLTSEEDEEKADTAEIDTGSINISGIELTDETESDANTSEGEHGTEIELTPEKRLENDDEEEEEGSDDITTYEGTGQISSMVPGYPDGLVDRKYRFNQLKFANTSLFLHDRVWIKAVKARDSMDWRITDMKLAKDPKALEIEKLQKFTLTFRKVKSVTPAHIHLEPLESVQGVSTECIHNTIAEVQLIPGDWLEVKTEEMKTTSESAPYSLGKIVASLCDRLEVKGKISEVLSDGNVTYATIDGCYYVPPCVWGSLILKKGSPVRAVVFKSDQKNFQFRAGSVKEDAAALQSVEKKRVNALCTDKRGVVITPEHCLDFGELNIGSKKDANITITSKSTFTQILRRIKIQEDQTAAKFVVDVKSEADDIVTVFSPGELNIVNVKISCEPLLVGQTADFCIFDFGDFQIYRELKVKVTPRETDLIRNLTSNRVSSRVHRKLQSTGNRELARKQEPFASTTGRQSVSAGIKQIRTPFFKAQVERIQPYQIPDGVREAVKTKDAKPLFEQFSTIAITEQEIRYAPIRKVTPDNYKDLFHVALWMEELCHLTRRQNDNLENVTFSKSGGSYFFEFPKLQDVFPKFHPNDPIRFVDPSDPEGKIFHANIARLGNAHIFVDLKEDVFKDYDGRPLSVEFMLGRTSYKRCHHAVDKIVENWGPGWLFPTEVACLEPRILFIEESSDGSHDNDAEPSTLSLICKRSGPKRKQRFGRQLPRGGKRAPSIYPVENALILEGNAGILEGDPESPAVLDMQLKWANKALNDEQKSAVRMILRGQARPSPYIIFGPPGTGKTVTVVEAVIQIFKLDRHSRILVCGPSNASVNQISSYLIEIGRFEPGEFIRFLGYNYSDAVIPELLKNYCFDGNQIQSVYNSRIIVTTCNSAAQFVEAFGLVQDRFTHVFVDEAGYCHEPDTLIPIILTSKNNEPPQIILAGDPNQLGPVIFDDYSAFYGLKKSFLERLMENPLYMRDEDFKYPSLLITKLIKNYRAHRDLLCLPSRLFYDNELIPASLENLGELAERLTFLPKRGIPLIFHGVRGEQSRDKDSPSWYNPTEVVQVIHYVKLLLENNCIPDDIGIISPYRKQVEKIKEALGREVKCRPIRVGSVEEFQGGEKKIIILSLVRSMELEDEKEILMRLSFAFSPKRFNVCVTRAKCLLIGIGNPHVFVQEYVWREFLKYAIIKGVYIGCDLPLILQTLATKCAQGLAPGQSLDYESDNLDSD